MYLLIRCTDEDCMTITALIATSHDPQYLRDYISERRPNIIWDASSFYAVQTSSYGSKLYYAIEEVMHLEGD